MEANDPREGVIFNLRGIIGRIYVKLCITMLHTKYRSFGSCGFREEDFSHYRPMEDFDIHEVWSIWTLGACMVGRIYNGDYQTLLHTKI